MFKFRNLALGAALASVAAFLVVDWDAVRRRLRKIKVLKNVVGNPGFEDPDLAPWTVEGHRSGWSEDPSDTDSDATPFVTTGGHKGGRCLNMNVKKNVIGQNFTYQTWASQAIDPPVPKETLVEASVWLRSKLGGLSLILNDSAEIPLGADGDEWQKHDFLDKIPDHMIVKRIAFHMFGDSDTTYVDDVVLSAYLLP